MTHCIRQQHLHVQVNGTEAEAMVLQQSLSDWCQDYLFSVIERTLDNYVPADEYWALECLTIEVGRLTLARLPLDLPCLVEQALAKALRNQQIVKTNQPIATMADVCRQATAQQHDEEAWLTFLKTGSLPWSWRLPQGKTLEQLMLECWQNQPLSIDKAIVRSVLAAAPIRQRLLWQFSPTFLLVLMQRIAPQCYKMIENLLPYLAELDGLGDSGKAFSRQLWATVLALSASDSAVTEIQLLNTVWRQLPAISRSDALIALLVRHWPELNLTANNTLSYKASGLAQVTDTRFQATANPLLAKLPDVGAQTQANLQSHSEPSAAAVAINEGVYIDNAGLVLLHPFLPQFFRALQIADAVNLLQPERALCLLHYLSTGQLSAAEYELVLPKLLCNIPLTEPVQSYLTLTEQEIAEADVLLAAVIQHWEVLRNTGIDGLRATYLLRSGKISVRADGDWLLQIENKAYDILLQQLPWGISIVKLPWMQKMLWVEWVY